MMKNAFEKAILFNSDISQIYDQSFYVGRQWMLILLELAQSRPPEPRNDLRLSHSDLLAHLLGHFLAIVDWNINLADFGDLFAMFLRDLNENNNNYQQFHKGKNKRPYILA